MGISRSPSSPFHHPATDPGKLRKGKGKPFEVNADGKLVIVDNEGGVASPAVVSTPVGEAMEVDETVVSVVAAL